MSIKCGVMMPAASGCLAFLPNGGWRQKDEGLDDTSGDLINISIVKVT